MIATLLILALFQAMTPQGSIEGVVMKAGTVVPQVLPNARVELTEGPGTPLVRRTDSGGRFAFSNLAPGRYRIQVHRDGFIRQEYGQRNLDVSGKPIDLFAGQHLQDIVFHLDPAPSVGGWVQEEAGEPLANVVVQALRRTYDARGNRTLSVFASALTNDLGEYRIFWIDPGEYFFFVSSMPPSMSDNSDATAPRAVVPTYYPGVSVPSDAKSIRLQVGREDEVDFRLRSTSFTSVGGYAYSVGSGRGVQTAIVMAPSGNDPSLSRFQTQSTTDGAYSIGSTVPPGAYLVLARTTSGAPLIGFNEITILPLRVAPPPVKLPEYNIRSQMASGLEVNGRVIVDTGSTIDIRKTRVEMVSAVWSVLSSGPATPQADGRFTLSGLTPGKYYPMVSGLPPDAYVKAYAYGATVLTDDSVTLEKDLSLPLQILVASDGGQIEASVVDSENQPAGRAQVVLAPDPARRQRPDQFRTALSEDDGRVVIRGVPPGDYNLFAWESIEPNAYLNKEFLQPYENAGLPVHVTPAASIPATVRMIPADR